MFAYCTQTLGCDLHKVQSPSNCEPNGNLFPSFNVMEGRKAQADVARLGLIVRPVRNMAQHVGLQVHVTWGLAEAQRSESFDCD